MVILHNPGKYTEVGAVGHALRRATPQSGMPKGVLLVGLPEQVTLLAKAVAGEADVPFFSISGSELWRCLWAWALPRCVTCSSRPMRRPLHRLY